MQSMEQTLTLRRAMPTDLAAVDALLSRSYPRLLAADYPPSALVLALPIISRARPELVSSGRYFVALEDERIVGAGGWSAGGPTDAATVRGVGHVRHVVTDDRRTRRGIGSAIMAQVIADARVDGFEWLDCLATRTAVPFYAALGFSTVQPVDVPLRPGIIFPAIRMLLRVGPGPQ
jgi:GNAT superfamily N-acetyltransferase